MRTNIVLDDDLVKAAFKYSKAKTKKDLIDEALKTFVKEHRRPDLRKLRGKLKLKDDYNYKAMRRGN
jgi:Arc/MetJ family transcription regulator